MEQNTFAENQSQQPEATPAVSQPVTEKMLPQSQVDEIVKREKHYAAERSAERVRKEYEEKSYQAPQNTTPVNTGNSGGLTEERIRQITAEEVQRRDQDARESTAREMLLQKGTETANQFISKVNAGKENYANFDKKLSEFINTLPKGFEDIADIVHLAANVEDTAGFMYDVINNPEKIVHYRQLSQVSPHLALERAHKVAQGIALNRQAANVKTANEPLSQIKPSPVGTDNGSSSITSLRKQSYLRG